jgi:enterochelin esterase-like enzyme
MTVPTADVLRRQILDGPGEDAAQVLTDLAAHGTPLITDDPDDPGCQRVLLAFVAPPGTAGVYAWVNRLTDGPHLDRGQLRRWGSTDLWCTELVVTRATMATYRYYPYAADDPHLRDGILVYSREVARAAVDDPTNAGAGSPFGSVLSTVDAPDPTLWQGGASTLLATGAAGGTDDDAEPIRWRLTVPVGRGPGPTRIIVVFDADKWFDEYGLPAAIADAADDTTAPIALLGIDSPTDPTTRLRQLGPNHEFLATVVGEILVPARSALEAAETTTVWAGQSLGAAAALAAACWFPDDVDEVLAYSPSIWWKPGLTARPAQWSDERSWLAEELAGATPRPVRLAVGRNEGLLVDPVTALARELSEAGWPATLRPFDGGHDIAWWAHLLLDDLTASDTRSASDTPASARETRR